MSNEDIPRAVISKDWLKGDDQILIKKCLSDAKEMVEKYPDLTKEYCLCSVQKLFDTMTKEEYLENTKKTQSEQLELFEPVIGKCLSQYQKKIKESN